MNRGKKRETREGVEELNQTLLDSMSLDRSKKNGFSYETRAILWKRKFLCIVLAIVLVALPVHASSTSDQIDDVNQQKEDAKERIDNMEERIDELEGLKGDLISYIQEMDLELFAVQERLEELEAQKVQKELDIQQAEQELIAAQQVEAEQYESMKLRIQFMYENGNESYMGILMQSDNFTDLLNKAEYVSQITSYDRKMLEEYQDTVATVIEKEVLLKQEKDILDGLIIEAESEEDSYTMLIDAKSLVVAEYEAEIEAGENAIVEVEADLLAFDEELKALEEKLRQETAVARVYNGGTFGFPVAWYYRVTSPFGWRIHPIFQTSKFHNGMDLSADTGTEIYAAYDGVVVVSTYSSSAGNYIMIEHGSGLSTVYMHCSKLLVSEGQNVSRGELIGLVGSTGNSTGPHLHFSVRLNGEYVEPASYIGL